MYSHNVVSADITLVVHNMNDMKLVLSFVDDGKGMLSPRAFAAGTTEMLLSARNSGNSRGGQDILLPTAGRCM